MAATRLTAAQLLMLKNDILANTNTVSVGGQSVQIKDTGNNGDHNQAVAGWYNGLASPPWTVWKILVSITEVGRKFNGAELAGLTTANVQRLTCIALFSSGGVNPSLPDQRAFFDDVFSGAGGNITRPALLALWKRLANRIEKLLSTGTGSDPMPATINTAGFLEGTISGTDVEEAR